MSSTREGSTFIRDQTGTLGGGARVLFNFFVFAREIIVGLCALFP